LADPYFPLDGNGGYDARHYRLVMRYDPPTDMLQGTATICARATKSLSSFNLFLVGLDVRAVRVNGRSARWTRGANELTITPRKTLRKHRRFVRVGRLRRRTADHRGLEHGHGRLVQYR
jgi:aminopeptidase N